MTRRDPRKPAERDVLRAVLEYLRWHPKVAWCARMNVGMVPVGNRKFRAGFVGCSDIIGMTKARRHYDYDEPGRFLAVEVKRPGGKATKGQAAFLAAVQKQGGVAFIATSLEDCERALR